MADSLAHVKAVLDLLNATTGITAYLGKRGSVIPCVVLYPDAGAAESSSLTPNEDLVVFIPLHAVAVGPDQALWLMDKVRAALTFAQPTVAGRYVHPMWQEQAPTPLQRDDGLQPPLFASFAEFGMRSQPS